jgi:HlyD family secretion protein
MVLLLKIKKALKKNVRYCFIFFGIMLTVVMFFLNSCMAMGPFGANNSNQSQTSGMETFEVTKGDIVQEITSTGSIISSQENTYNLEVTGVVLSTLSEGEKFKKGDIIVQVDDSDGQDDIYKLEIDLKSAKNSMQNAKNALTSARLNYQSALDSNHIAIQQADLNTRQSEISVENAIRSLEDANRSADLSVESAKLALEKIEDMEEYISDEKDEEQSEYEYKSAEIQLDGAENSAGSSVNQAESSYEKSLLDASSTYWNNLSSLQSASKQIEVTRLNISDAQTKVEEAQTNVELAEKDLEQAKEDLENYTVTATYDGIVLSNEYKTGQKTTQVSSSTGGITVVKDQYLIESSISENDISKVEEGNEALITLDAYSGKEFNGIVSKIVPVSSIGDNNVISFTIYVDFSGVADVDLYSGLTANLTITVSSAKDVLYVPIQAVYKENGKPYVDVVTSPQPESGQTSKNTKTAENNVSQSTKKVEVTTGINDYTNIEIKSGLKEGDIVVTSKK